MSWLSSFFSSTPGEQRSETTFNPQVEGAIQQLVGGALSTYGQPYQAYGGQRIAPLNWSQEHAIATGNMTAANPNPYLQAAWTQSMNVPGQLNGLGEIPPELANNHRATTAGLQGYGQMSPYMQNVVDVTKQQAIRDFGEAQAGRDTEAVNAGAFGGSRQAVAQGVAERGLADRLTNIQATGMQGAWDQAQQYGLQAEGLGIQNNAAFNSLWNNAQNQRLQAAQTNLNAGQLMGSLGTAYRNDENSRVNTLMQLGALQQGQQQQGYDLAYQDFLQQRDYPMAQANFLNQILSGTPSQQTIQTGSNTQSAPSPFVQVGGTAMGLAGLGKAIGWDNVGSGLSWIGRQGTSLFNSLGFAHGGTVR